MGHNLLRDWAQRTYNSYLTDNAKSAEKANLLPSTGKQPATYAALKPDTSRPSSRAEECVGN
jgi:hypothetical protein